MISSLIHQIFPSHCDFCNRILSGKDFPRCCSRCLVLLKWRYPEQVKKEFCPICYHKLKKKICPSCSKNEGAFNFEKNESLFFYEGMGEEFIQNFKFQNFRSYAAIITYLALKNKGDYLRSFDVIVPIILGKKGFFERDFCAVSEVVKILAKKLRVPVLKCISRNEKKYKKSQHSKTALERKNEIEDKYLYSKKYMGHLNKKKVLLIDDVFTTGSTLDFTASLIKKNNHLVRRIATFTFSRVILD